MLKPRSSIVVELRIQSMSWREMIISREKVIQAPAAPVEDIPLPRLEPPKLTQQRRDPGDGLGVLSSLDVTTYFLS